MNSGNKNMRYSILELDVISEGSNPAETFKKSLELAQRAEEFGYHRFWLAEHHNAPAIACSATSVLIAHIAGGTNKIRVGSGGIMLPNHPPLVVAEQFGTLEALHPGRIDLGLGRAPGTDPITSRALHRDDRRAEKFPQEVEELQYFLGPYKGHGVRAYPGSDSNVPIWILGSSMFSAQLAAAKGLPYAFAGHFAPTLAEQALSYYRQNFQSSEALAKPHAILCLPLILGADDAEAEYLATSSIQRILALIQGKPLYIPAPVESMDGLWDPISKMHVENFLGLSVVGGPETVAFKLQSVIERFAVDELMFTNDIYSRDKRIQALELLAQLK